MHFEFDMFSYLMKQITVKFSLPSPMFKGSTDSQQGLFYLGLKGSLKRGTCCLALVLHSPIFSSLPIGWGQRELAACGEGLAIHLSEKPSNFPDFPRCIHSATLNSIYPSFIHPLSSIHVFTQPFIHSSNSPVCLEELPTSTSMTSIFLMNVHHGRGEGNITGPWPTAAGTTPLLSSVIWLSPSLLATEGKGYYSFVAFESLVLSELPSLSSSS